MTILGQTLEHCHKEFRDVKVREDLMIREQVTEMNRRNTNSNVQLTLVRAHLQAYHAVYKSKDTVITN